MKELYCVFDVVAKEAFPPFIANNCDVAMRIFCDGMAKQSLNSADFDLYFLGKFDVESAKIVDPDSRVVKVDLVSQGGKLE